MDTEAFQWIVGAGAIPLLAWLIALTIKLITFSAAQEQAQTSLNLLIKMHTSTNTIIKDNTLAIEALTHYMKWWIEHEVGEAPPPKV